MPPSTKITKEMILETEYEFVMTSGIESINSRSIAKALGCSTQLIFSQFLSLENNDLDDYKAYSQKVISNLITNENNGSDPLEVAETIFNAANSKSDKMRYPVGKSKNLIALSRILPDKVFHNLVSAEMQK